MSKQAISPLFQSDTHSSPFLASNSYTSRCESTNSINIVYFPIIPHSFMSWGGVNRVIKQTMQCHRCYTFPCIVLLIHAVGWFESGDETYKSMPQLQINAVGVVRLIA